MLEADVLEDTGHGQLAAVVARPADQGKSHVGRHAGYIQHNGLLAGAECLEELLADSGRAEDIGLPGGPPALQVLFNKRAVVRELAGVIDEDFGGAKGLEDGGDSRAIGCVGGKSLESHGGELLGEGVLGLFDAFLAATQDANTLDARGRKSSGNMGTDTMTGAGDQHTFASERAAWNRRGERRVRLLVVGDKRCHDTELGRQIRLGFGMVLLLVSDMSSMRRASDQHA